MLGTVLSIDGHTLTIRANDGSVVTRTYDCGGENCPLEGRRAGEMVALPSWSDMPEFFDPGVR
jgi:hypothetical protein